MTLYMSVTILIALLMIAMTIHVLNHQGFNRHQKGWFVATFMSILFCSAAEFLVHSGYYDVKFKIPLTIITVLQFSLSPCIAMLFAGALGLKYQEKVGFVFLGISFTAEFISAFFGWVFFFSETGYERGPVFLIYEIL